MRRTLISLYKLLAAGALALAIVACAGDAEPTNTPTSPPPTNTPTSPPPTNTPTSTPEPLSVVASIYPMQYFAERVGGDRVEVVGLVPPGTEAHGFELTPRDIRAITEADVVAMNGLGLELWLERVLESLGDEVSGIVVEASYAEAAAPFEGGEDGHGHGHEEEEGEHADEDEHGHMEEGEHEDEHGHMDEHGHGEFDPHFWLDPMRAIAQAERIAEAFIKADPEGADIYRANLATFSSELRALHAEFEAGLSSCVHREFVTSHSAYGYLALVYGLEQVGVAGLSPEAEPSAQRLASIADRIRELGITAVLLEPVLSGENIRSLASETGAGIYPIHAIESVTLNELDEHGDYFGLMRDNLNSLRAAMECS